MGRRSRRRDAGRPAAPAPPPSAPGVPRALRRRATSEEAPQAPWHPFPLVELAILAGLVLTIAGFVVRGRSGGILVSGGVLLIAVGALEVAIREHVTGFRSHTALLAGVIAVPIVGVLLFAGVPRIAALAVGVGVGAGAFVTLRRMFVRKAGGLTWRA